MICLHASFHRKKSKFKHGNICCCWHNTQSQSYASCQLCQQVLAVYSIYLLFFCCFLILKLSEVLDLLDIKEPQSDVRYQGKTGHQPARLLNGEADLSAKAEDLHLRNLMIKQEVYGCEKCNAPLHIECFKIVHGE